MGGLERVDDLARHCDRLFNRHRATPDARGGRFPVRQLQHQELRVAVVFQSVDRPDAPRRVFG